MWVASSLQPQKPWPPNTISAPTTPPLRRRSTVVNNIRNREAKMGGTGLGLSQAVNTTLKSKGPPQNLDAVKSKTKAIVPSGADVLKALERATAQKAMRKKEKKKLEAGAVSKKIETQGPPCNFDNVRALCIQPDWDDRLEELERRLQQLADM